MLLTVITLDQAVRWDTTVRSFKEYDTYWLSGYVKAFFIHGDGVPLLFYYEDGRTRAINVVMKRDIAEDEHLVGKIQKGKYFDFATPYGYGGWLVEGEATEELFSVYDAWCRKNGIITEFVRFHPLLNNHRSCEDFYEVIQLGEVVHMDLSSPKLIAENLKSQNRNKIRKALKNNIKIFNGRFAEIYNTFREIYNQTMDKVQAKPYYYFKEDFYKSLLFDLPQNAQVFYAVKNGDVIAASIFLMSNGRMSYHFSGSLQEYSKFAATNLLLYEAALWGNANGYKTLLLGGGVGSKDDGVLVFKKSFYRGNLNRFHIGRKIFDNDKYNELSNLRCGIPESEFFPKYRA